jgi:hypothetical protein
MLWLIASDWLLILRSRSRDQRIFRKKRCQARGPFWRLPSLTGHPLLLTIERDPEPSDAVFAHHRGEGNRTTQIPVVNCEYNKAHRKPVYTYFDVYGLVSSIHKRSRHDCKHGAEYCSSWIAESERANVSSFTPSWAAISSSLSSLKLT